MGAVAAKVAGVVVVAGIMASGVHHGHGHGGGIFAHFTAAHTSGLDTRGGFARALLRAEHAPVNGPNMCAVITWEAHEGGGFGNQAAYNPLNVNPGPGAGWPGYNAIGAWAFPDAQTGFRYTVATLNNGYYPGIRAALHRGSSAQDVLNAIEASPWAASHYGGSLTPSC